MVWMNDRYVVKFCADEVEVDRRSFTSNISLVDESENTCTLGRDICKRCRSSLTTVVRIAADCLRLSKEDMRVSLSREQAVDGYDLLSTTPTL